MLHIVETNFQSSSQKNTKKNSVIIIGVFILIVIIIGTLASIRQPTNKVIDVVSATIPKKVTPIEKPKIDKSIVKIQVMNGTGISGQAGDVVNTLVTAGYNSDNIRPNNADDFDNTKTVISVRDNFEETASDIEKILKKAFTEVSISSTKIDKHTEFDIVVVTGSSVSSMISQQ